MFTQLQSAMQMHPRLPTDEIYCSAHSNTPKLDGLRLPRHRQFDEGIAIEAAMQHFWAAGYAATFVRDLGDAMALGQASVYNAFGDKRTPFTRCLDRYLDANMCAAHKRRCEVRPSHREYGENSFISDRC